jgi:transposase InsO family protein
LEAIPLKDMSAASCADALISGWVSRFGVPSLITSDRGTQFTSAVWEALCNKLGVAHTTTTAYHPQANGLVERAHRQLKEALRSRLAGAAWPDHLPWALLGLRAAPKDDSNISSAELVYGAPLVLPGEFLDTAL